MNLLDLRSIMGSPRGTLSVFMHAFWAKRELHCLFLGKKAIIITSQGCALAEPGGPWRLTFALGRLEDVRYFIQFICWAP